MSHVDNGEDLPQTQCSDSLPSTSRFTYFKVSLWKAMVVLSLNMHLSLPDPSWKMAYLLIA